MSKTPQEVEEYLRKYGPQSPGSPMAAAPSADADPVADYLNKYGAAKPDGNDSQLSQMADRLRMGAQGMTFGLADEAAGVLDAGLHKITGGRFGKTYSESVEGNRARDAAFREAHPVQAIASNIVGGAGAGAMSGAASLLPKAASYLGKIGIGAGAGAGAGAIAGAGEAEGSLMTEEGRDSRLEGAIGGAKMGALFGGGFAAAAPAVSRVGSVIADISGLRPGPNPMFAGPASTNASRMQNRVGAVGDDVSRVEGAKSPFIDAAGGKPTAASIKLKDGRVFSGRTHAEAHNAAMDADPSLTWDVLLTADDGFIVNGEHVPRRITGRMVFAQEFPFGRQAQQEARDWRRGLDEQVARDAQQPRITLAHANAIASRKEALGLEPWATLPDEEMAKIVPGWISAGPQGMGRSGAVDFGALARGGERAARSVIRNTQERGDDILLQALERSGKSVDDVRGAVAGRASGPAKPESLMEIAGQPMQRLGRSVRTAPGRGSALMDEALSARSAGAEERIISDLLETSGQGRPTNRFQHLDDLIDERRANAKPLYEKAYQAAPIDDPEILQTLELPQFQQAYQRAQRIAKLEGVVLPEIADGVAIPIQALDYVKRGLDDVIESGMKSGSIARTEARALRNRLKDMLEQVDERVPEYKAARAQFAGDSELIEAAEKGKDLFKTHPDEARSYIESLSEAGKDAYRKQALSALQDRIENIAPGNNVSRRVGEKTLDQKRLRLLFPDDASFDTFKALLQREAEMHGTKGFVMGGSQTADKLTELADLAGISVEMMMGMANPGRLAQLLTQNALTRGARGVTERNAEAIAQRLRLGMGSDGNAEYDVLLKALAEAEARRASQQTRRAGQTIGVGAAGGQSGGRERNR